MCFLRFLRSVTWSHNALQAFRFGRARVLLCKKPREQLRSSSFGGVVLAVVFSGWFFDWLLGKGDKHILLVELVTSSQNNHSLTPPKTNMSPEKWWLEDYIFSFWNGLFSGDIRSFSGRYQKIHSGESGVSTFDQPNKWIHHVRLYPGKENMPASQSNLGNLARFNKMSAKHVVSDSWLALIVITAFFETLPGYLKLNLRGS